MSENASMKYRVELAVLYPNFTWDTEEVVVLLDDPDEVDVWSAAEEAIVSRYEYTETPIVGVSKYYYEKLHDDL